MCHEAHAPHGTHAMQGRTTLHVACQAGGSVELLKELLRSKPAVDSQDFAGNLPLHYAAERVGHNQLCLVMPQLCLWLA